MKTTYATGDHDRGWLPDPPPHVMVQCVMSVQWAQDAPARATLTTHLQRIAADLPAVAASGRDWSLGPLTYRPMVVPNDPWSTRHFGHPLGRRSATEVTVAQLAATLAAADPEEIDGQWVLHVSADVVWGALRQ